MRPFDDITRIERAQVLDKPVAAVRAVVTRVLRNRTVKDALHGVWLGHPLHPGAAQFTAGSLLSASSTGWTVTRPLNRLLLRSFSGISLVRRTFMMICSRVAN